MAERVLSVPDGDRCMMMCKSQGVVWCRALCKNQGRRGYHCLISGNELEGKVPFKDKQCEQETERRKMS